MLEQPEMGVPHVGAAARVEEPNQVPIERIINEIKTGLENIESEIHDLEARTLHLTILGNVSLIISILVAVRVFIWH
ncbi:MAG: hypothetical protein AB7V46_21785 [Thermomicrobiales bacterium]